MGAVQLSIILALALLLLIDSSRAAASLLLGGLCCLVPNLLFARRFFSYRYARQLKQVVQAFYRGEVFKMVLIGLLSIFVFVTVRIEPLFFFLGFIVAQVTLWVGSGMYLSKQVSKQNVVHS